MKSVADAGTGASIGIGNVADTALKRVITDLDRIPHSTEPATLAEKSRDHFWFSPILKSELEGLTADLLVTPGTQDEVLQVISACARHRVPITARGAGTGNFGQSVPLAGGVLLDMTKLNRMVWMRGAAARAEAGMLTLDFDRETRRQGWEMRMHPSTKRVATLGGFIAGGHAGIGSVNYGILRDRGNILGLKLATIEPEPRILEIRGADLTTVHHAYGVNGVMLEVELPLAPAYPWRDLIITFSDFMQAARFGWALASADGMAKKLISPVTATLAQHFHALRPVIPPGQHPVFAMVASESMEALRELVQEFGGSVTLDCAEGEHLGMPVYEFTWGHTTMRVLEHQPDVTYLICIFGGADPLAQVREVHERFGAEAPLHLEFKRLNGKLVVEGIPVFHYTGPAQIDKLSAAFQALGVKIANVHTYFLQNGGMHLVDEAQINFKRATDPFNLMNPGKIAGFDEIDGAPGGAAHIKAAGWAY